MVAKVGALEAEKHSILSAHQRLVHEKDKKIVKLQTQVSMGGNVFNALTVGMQMAKKGMSVSFDSPSAPTTASSTTSAGASSSTARTYEQLFTVASPD